MCCESLVGYFALLARGLHQNALGFPVCFRDPVVCDFYVCLLEPWHGAHSLTESVPGLPRHRPKRLCLCVPVMRQTRLNQLSRLPMDPSEWIPPEVCDVMVEHLRADIMIWKYAPWSANHGTPDTLASAAILIAGRGKAIQFVNLVVTPREYPELIVIPKFGRLRIFGSHWNIIGPQVKSLLSISLEWYDLGYSRSLWDTPALEEAAEVISSFRRQKPLLLTQSQFLTS